MLFFHFLNNQVNLVYYDFVVHLLELLYGLWTASFFIQVYFIGESFLQNSNNSRRNKTPSHCGWSRDSEWTSEWPFLCSVEHSMGTEDRGGEKHSSPLSWPCYPVLWGGSGKACHLAEKPCENIFTGSSLCCVCVSAELLWERRGDQFCNNADR